MLNWVMSRDARADAAAQLSKAQSQLDAMTVLSTLEGTVVEVNRNVPNLQQEQAKW